MWIGQGDRYAFIFCLQPKSDTGNSTASPCRTRKPVDTSVHLRPNFLCGSFDVRSAISNVVELVRPDGILGFLRQTARGVNEMAGVRVRSRWHQNQFGTQRT